MLKVVLICTMVCAVCADVSHILNQYKNLPAGEPVPILRNDRNINEDGSYSYYYETANGIVGHEDGSANSASDAGTLASGGYHYRSPEGRLIKISYVADENGYHPSGDIISANSR